MAHHSDNILAQEQIKNKNHEKQIAALMNIVGSSKDNVINSNPQQAADSSMDSDDTFLRIKKFSDKLRSYTKPENMEELPNKLPTTSNTL
jgi:hypothetical protein